MTEKKEPIKLGSQFYLSDPTQEQSQQNPGGPPLQNDCASYTPLAYKLRSGAAYSAKMQYSQLFKNLQCEKHMWLNYHSTPSTYSFRLPQEIIKKA